MSSISNSCYLLVTLTPYNVMYFKFTSSINYNSYIMMSYILNLYYLLVTIILSCHVFRIYIIN